MCRRRRVKAGPEGGLDHHRSDRPEKREEEIDPVLEGAAEAKRERCAILARAPRRVADARARDAKAQPSWPPRYSRAMPSSRGTSSIVRSATGSSPRTPREKSRTSARSTSKVASRRSPPTATAIGAQPAVSLETGERDGRGEDELDHLALGESGVDADEGAVVDDRAPIDQDDALAELLDVGEVVAREHHGRARALVEGLHEFRGWRAGTKGRGRSSARRGRGHRAYAGGPRLFPSSSARRARGACTCTPKRSFMPKSSTSSPKVRS